MSRYPKITKHEALDGFGSSVTRLAGVNVILEGRSGPAGTTFLIYGQYQLPTLYDKQFLNTGKSRFKNRAKFKP